MHGAPSFLKSATHTPEENSALIITDHKASPFESGISVNGWPVGKEESLLVVSIRLVSSTTRAAVRLSAH